MGANTAVYVKVLKTYEDIIEVSALGRTDAEIEATLIPGVVAVLGSSYEREDLNYD